MVNQTSTPLADYDNFLNNHKDVKDVKDVKDKKSEQAKKELQVAMSSFATLVDLRLEDGSELFHLAPKTNEKTNPNIKTEIFNKDQTALNAISQHFKQGIQTIRDCDAKITYLKAMNNPQTLATELGIKDINGGDGNVALQKKRTKIGGQINELKANVKEGEESNPEINTLKKKLTQCDLLQDVLNKRIKNKNINPDQKADQKAARSKKINELNANKAAALKEMQTEHVNKKFTAHRNILQALTESKNSNLREVLDQLHKSEKEWQNRSWLSNKINLSNNFSANLITRPTSLFRIHRQPATFKQEQIMRGQYGKVTQSNYKNKEQRNYQASDIHGGYPDKVHTDYTHMCPSDIEDVVAQLQAEGKDVRISYSFYGADGKWEMTVKVNGNGVAFDNAMAAKNQKNKDTIEAEENMNPRIDTNQDGKSASATLNPTQLDASTTLTPGVRK